MKKKISLSILMLLVVFSFTLPIAASNFPVTVVDDLGKEVEMEQEPQRIISMAPSITEMLFSIGLGDRIVGVTTYADYPKAATQKTKIGSVTEPNIEKIISLKPDLVLAAGINKKPTIKKLKKLGIKVGGFSPGTIKATVDVISKVGRLTGLDQNARQIAASMSVKVNEIKELVNSKLADDSRPKVFFEIWSDPLITAGKGTFVNDLIRIAGGENIGAKAQGSWPQYNMETLLIKNPDVYITTPHSAPSKVTVKSLRNRENYESINAIKNNRVSVINQDLVSRPSPRIIQGLKLFVKAIFPGLADEVEDI
jgi:iron complex transport system substrate-binding protein